MTNRLSQEISPTVATLDDLAERLSRTRWPDEPPLRVVEGQRHDLPRLHVELPGEGASSGLTT